MRLTSVKDYEKQFSGGEPTWKNGEGSVVRALNWYNYHSDTKESKKYAIDYLKDNKYSPKDIALFEKLSEDHFKNLGFVCRIKSRGAKLTKSNLDWIQDSFTELKRRSEVENKKVVEPKATISIQERTLEKSKEYIGEIESIIDDCFLVRDFNAIEPYEAMQLMGVKAAHAAHVIKFFNTKIEHLEEAVKGKDPQLVEGYSNFSKKELREYLAYHKKIISDAEKLSHNVKLTRKPRKKKVKPVDKVVSKIVYKKEDAEYKIASVNPTDIIGCSQLWVFNTKTRKLGVYNSIDESGLSVKGTTILNFNEQSSIHKTVRKPEAVLADLVKCGKVSLRKFMSTINSVEQNLTGRINADTILVRIIK
jgi:hypothetical protein